MHYHQLWRGTTSGHLIKVEVRKLKWNKSIWTRAVRQVSPAATGEAVEPVVALQLNEKGMRKSSNDVLALLKKWQPVTVPSRASILRSIIWRRTYRRLPGQHSVTW